ncbi:hypothetical protein PVAND_000182 [Polypedilum vanderplanki]|uniref:Thioredoxin domain-containing protein n=1 Tax=Polypedilum vanderplanki TaxID=319348 RepID=A0A9J6BK36_POLVA|nr:hypothetical protein PVAND_000182 [Polypedilum vanderplanki]
MSKALIIDIKDEKDYENRVLNSKDPVVVSFDTPWCESCNILNLKIKEVVGKYKGKVIMAKVNTNDLPNLVPHNSDTVILPIVAIAKDGKIQSHIEGVQGTDDIKKFVDENVKKNIKRMCICKTKK